MPSLESYSAQACGNHLLSLLSDEDYRRLLPRLERAPTTFKQVLFERDEPIPYVYFPCSSVLSVLALMQDGATVEIGTVGNEGFTSINLFLGGATATDTCVCQVAGDNIRMRSTDFSEAISGNTPLRQVVQRYVPVYISQVSQSVACNRLHTIEERFARWLLMTQDRVQCNRFHLTQEFLADMLGVHRPSVSLVAGAFQQARMITYSRGNMTILNRRALEETACECYDVVKRQSMKWLGLTSG